MIPEEDISHGSGAIQGAFSVGRSARAKAERQIEGLLVADRYEELVRELEGDAEG